MARAEQSKGSTIIRPSPPPYITMKFLTSPITIAEQSNGLRKFSGVLVLLFIANEQPVEDNCECSGILSLPLVL